jgi:hypothetical protein
LTNIMTFNIQHVTPRVPDNIHIKVQQEGSGPTIDEMRNTPGMYPGERCCRLLSAVLGGQIIHATAAEICYIWCGSNLTSRMHPGATWPCTWWWAFSKVVSCMALHFQGHTAPNL